MKIVSIVGARPQFVKAVPLGIFAVSEGPKHWAASTQTGRASTDSRHVVPGGASAVPYEHFRRNTAVQAMIVCPFHNFGGTERSAVTVAHSLRARGIATVLVGNRHPMLEQARSLGLTVEFIDAPRRTPNGIIRSAAELAKLLDCYSPKVLAFQSGLIAATTPLIRRFAKTWRGTVVWHDRGIREARRWVAASVWPRLVDRIVVNCADERDRFVRAGMPPSLVSVVYNLPTLRIPSMEEAARRPKRGDKFTVVGTVGRLHRDRRVHDFVEMAGWLVRKTHRPLKFVIVGDGPERGRLERLVAEQGLSSSLLLTGALADVEPMYRQMDIYVSPVAAGRGYGGAGIGNSLVEAMYWCLPVVATRTSGIPEFVEHGLNGCLVSVGDIDAMVRAVLKLTDDVDLRIQMGLAARSTVERLADPERILDQLICAYGLSEEG